MIEAIQLKIMVKPDERITETDSGIYVGDHYNPEKGMRRGEVVSVGLGCRDVKVGDKVCFMAFTGLAVNYEGTRYLTMYESEVLAVSV